VHHQYSVYPLCVHATTTDTCILRSPRVRMVSLVVDGVPTIPVMHVASPVHTTYTWCVVCSGTLHLLRTSYVHARSTLLLLHHVYHYYASSLLRITDTYPLHVAQGITSITSRYHGSVHPRDDPLHTVQGISTTTPRGVMHYM